MPLTDGQTEVLARDDARFTWKYVNPHGETRWQPVFPDGRRAWKGAMRFFPWSNEWARCGTFDERVIDGPRLYRSRARAARVARRQWAKLAENQ